MTVSKQAGGEEVAVGLVQSQIGKNKFPIFSCFGMGVC